MRRIGGLNQRDKETAERAFQAVNAGSTAPSPMLKTPPSRSSDTPLARPTRVPDPATPPHNPPPKSAAPLHPQRFYPPAPRKFVPIPVSSDEEFDTFSSNRSVQSSPVRHRSVSTGTRFIHRRTGEELVCIVPTESGKLVLMNEQRQQIVKVRESDLALLPSV
jgi:hypothetical protein